MQFSFVFELILRGCAELVGARSGPVAARGRVELLGMLEEDKIDEEEVRASPPPAASKAATSGAPAPSAASAVGADGGPHEQIHSPALDLCQHPPKRIGGFVLCIASSLMLVRPN